MLWKWTFFALLLLSFPAPAGTNEVDAVANMCSARHLSIYSVQEIVNKIIQRKLEKPGARIDCGLPGEDLRVCKGCTTMISREQLETLTPLLKTPEHQQWHTQWHARRKREKPCEKKKQGAGESFLSMHREMLKMAMAKLVGNGQVCFRGWDTLPEKMDPALSITGNATTFEMQSAWLQDLKKVEAKLSQKEHLKKISLDQLGCEIESQLHQELHRIFETENFETSPLSPSFWMIHGYIDSYIGKWLTANPRVPLTFPRNAAAMTGRYGEK